MTGATTISGMWDGGLAYPVLKDPIGLLIGAGVATLESDKRDEDLKVLDVRIGNLIAFLDRALSEGLRNLEAILYLKLKSNRKYRKQ